MLLSQNIGPTGIRVEDQLTIITRLIKQPCCSLNCSCLLAHSIEIDHMEYFNNFRILLDKQGLYPYEFSLSMKMTDIDVHGNMNVDFH